MDKRLKLNKQEILFFSAFIFYCGALFMDVIALEDNRTIKQILVLCSVTLLIADFCLFQSISLRYIKKLTWKRILLFLFIFYVVIISFMTQNYFLISILLFSLNFNHIERDKILRVSMYTIMIFTLLTMFACLLGLLPNVQNLRVGLSDGGVRVRNGLGFKGSLFMPNNLVYILAYYYSTKKKSHISEYIVFFIAGIIIYKLCDSRNGILTLNLLLVLQIFWQAIDTSSLKVKYRIRGLIERGSKVSYLACALISFVLLYAYKQGNMWVVVIDELISGRVRWVYMNTLKKPFEWIHIENSTDFANSLLYAYDDGYYYIVARYGYFMLIILILLSMQIAEYLISRKNYRGLISFAVVALVNFVDNGFISYGFYPYILIGISYVIEKNVKKIHSAIGERKW